MLNTPIIPILQSKKYAAAAAFTAALFSLQGSLGFDPDSVLIAVTSVWLTVIIANFIQNVLSITRQTADLDD